MTEGQIIELLSKGGITILLVMTVYYLHNQYNQSIARFYEREREFYNIIIKKLDDINDELKRKN